VGLSHCKAPRKEILAKAVFLGGLVHCVRSVEREVLIFNPLFRVLRCALQTSRFPLAQDVCAHFSNNTPTQKTARLISSRRACVRPLVRSSRRRSAFPPLAHPRQATYECQHRRTFAGTYSSTAVVQCSEDGHWLPDPKTMSCQLFGCMSVGELQRQNPYAGIVGRCLKFLTVATNFRLYRFLEFYFCAFIGLCVVFFSKQLIVICLR